LVAAGWLVSLEDFTLYMFRGLQGEFKDLVTSLVTKAKTPNMNSPHQNEQFDTNIVHFGGLNQCQSRVLLSTIRFRQPISLLSQLGTTK